MNRPLPPTCASDAVASLSPLVRISTISISIPLIASASFCATIDACASASLLDREPSLSLIGIRVQRAAHSVVGDFIVRVVFILVRGVEFGAQQAARDFCGKRTVENLVVALLEA